MARRFGEGQTGLSNRVQLGDIRKLALSPRVVARVWTTEPQLLRMQVFTNFDSRTGAWSVEPARPREVLPSDAAGASLGPLLSAAPGGLFFIAPETHGAVVETRVVPSLSFEDGWGLLLPARPTLLRLPAEKITVDDDTGTVVVSRSPSIYGIATSSVDRRVSSEPPFDDPTRKVQRSPLVEEKATSLRMANATPRQKLDRTVAHFKATRYRYTLEGLPTSLDDFLVKKAGHCQFFATAAVMLLREQGVPARYVRGVRVNPESHVGDHYLVRESDSHAWIEAYLPGEGWVEADPTPAGSGPSGAGRLEGMAARWEAFQSAFIEAWIRVRESWPAVRAGLGSLAERLRVAIEHRPVRSAATVVVVALALVAWALRKRIRRATRPTVRRRQDRAPVPAELRDLVGKVERRWARAGRPRPPNRGLHEHLHGLPPGALATAERDAAARIVATYYRTRYGGAPLGEAELSDLRARASSLLR